ncbi:MULTISPECIES: hypothetical protein [unclassified Pseudoalteromonas]|nr:MULTISPECIES: hypothetical protein [unclassified Pseudoalteromonas]
MSAEFKVDAHHWFTLHARKSKCGSYIIKNVREFKDKTEQLTSNI